MLSLKDLFFSKILLIKQYLTNIQIIEGVGIKEKINAQGQEKTLGGIMLEHHYITRKQYATVMKIQRQTLLTCKSCGLKYHLDELNTEDSFQCELCGSVILKLEELASLNLEPLFQKANAQDSKIIETACFFLEALPEEPSSTSATSSKAEDMVNLTATTARIVRGESLDQRERTTKLRFNMLEDESELLLGKKIDQYTIVSKLGEGGSCVVFQARTDEDSPVAIKILKNGEQSDRHVVDRLIQEVQVASKIHHPNIIRVLSSGEQDGYYYIVMEYIEGETLRQKILKHHRLPIAEALNIMEQVTQGLAAAHNQNVVHRDIKPDNIIIDQKGVAKIADFGLAKGKAIDAHITRTGQIVGTPYYMSPEQAQTSSLDHRSDIYSLGVTFYYILTGRVPFEGATPIEIILKHISTQPKPIETYNPQVPSGIAGIVSKMMAKSKDQRYQSALALLDDLKKIKNIQAHCFCGETFSYPFEQGGQLEQCPKCQSSFWVPQEGGQKRSRTFVYPTWREFVIARIGEEKKFFSRDKAAQSLALLLDSRRLGLSHSLFEILERLGVGKKQIEEIKISLELEIDVKNFPFLFGQVALRNNLISQEDLLVALARQKELSSSAPKLGELLVHQGLLTEKERDFVLGSRRRAIGEKVDGALMELIRQNQTLPPEKMSALSRQLAEDTLEQRSLPQLLLEQNFMDESAMEQLLQQCFFQNLYKFS